MGWAAWTAAVLILVLVSAYAASRRIDQILDEEEDEPW